MQETEGGFYTQPITTLDPTDVGLTVLRTDLDGELDRFTNVGSGWMVFNSAFYNSMVNNSSVFTSCARYFMNFDVFLCFSSIVLRYITSEN
jgi:hypothetical protein